MTIKIYKYRDNKHAIIPEEVREVEEWQNVLKKQILARNNRRIKIAPNEFASGWTIANYHYDNLKKLLREAKENVIYINDVEANDAHKAYIESTQDVHSVSHDPAPIEPDDVDDQEDAVIEPDNVDDQEDAAIEPDDVDDQEDPAIEPDDVDDQEDPAIEPDDVDDQEDPAIEPDDVDDIDPLSDPGDVSDVDNNELDSNSDNSDDESLSDDGSLTSDQVNEDYSLSDSDQVSDDDASSPDEEQDDRNHYLQLHRFKNRVRENTNNLFIENLSNAKKDWEKIKQDTERLEKERREKERREKERLEKERREKERREKERREKERREKERREKERREKERREKELVQSENMNEKEKYLRKLRRIKRDSTYKQYSQLDEYLQSFSKKPSRRY
jgi:hypothetical protein